MGLDRDFLTLYELLFFFEVIIEKPIKSLVSGHIVIVVPIFKLGGSLVASKKARSFKFEEFWLKMDKCFDVINGAWDGCFSINGRVGKMEDNINVCFYTLSTWNLNVVGHIQKRFDKLEKKTKHTSEVHSQVIDMRKFKIFEK